MALLGCSWSLTVLGGGSGLNTVVIVNQNSSQSCELGNYYCERRQVPPENVLRIPWSGSNITWASSEFETNLLGPLLSMLADRHLTNQIDYLVLSMDLPYQTVKGSTVNSTTAALFYGLKPDTNGSKGYANSYAGSEAVFRQAPPATAPGYSFLATMITANSLTQAKKIVDQGALGDYTSPDQPVILQKTPDPARNVRYPQFDNTVFNAQLLGRNSILRTNSDSPPATLPVAGYLTGLQTLTLASNTFVPGAIADSLTSWGGLLFQDTGQTSLLAFLEAGAAGSYGNVGADPASDPQKFPNSQDYFYQMRGFSLAECYYQSLNYPFAGLIVGEPLSAPFAQTAAGKWLGIASNAVLSGTASLSVAFSPKKSSAPLQQIDLFVDGKFFQTVTNLGPWPGNQLTLALQGYPLSYTVPTNATLANLTTGLVALINTPAITNVTKVKAFAHGDRFELHSLSTNLAAEPIYYLDNAVTNENPRYYRVSYVPFPLVPQLSTSGLDGTGRFHAQVETPPGVPFVLLASIDLKNWSPVWTNFQGGAQDFVDSSVSAFPRRFYRVSAADQHPKLNLTRNGGGNTLTLHVSSQTTLPYAIEGSTNLVDWLPLSTNLAGGSSDLVGLPSTNTPGLFYRAAVLPPALPPPMVSITSAPAANGTLIGVAGAVRAYTIDVSTNLSHWTSLFTNVNLSPGQVGVSSAPGNASVLSTFLSADQPAFLNSPAYGIRTFALSGTAQSTNWLQLQVVKTNGSTVSVSVTNTGTETLAQMAQRLVTAVNTSPDLQGGDGLAGQDFITDPFGAPSFNLRALGSGYQAATLRARLTASANLSVSPYNWAALDWNLSDLQPRDNLYLRAGAANLAASFPLDTTVLADGFHELAAVAYEGTHVRTQARTTLPFQVQNSPLSASLTLLDLGPTNQAQGTYHLQVEANTNTVSAISLFSTGGLLAATNNQPAAIFTMNGTLLGPGLHPFYAVVQTTDNLQYRTSNHWVRLVNVP